MDLRYEEWLPDAVGLGVVTAYWRVAGDASKVPSSAVLPDGHVELVFIRLEYLGPVNTFGI